MPDESSSHPHILCLIETKRTVRLACRGMELNSENRRYGLTAVNCPYVHVPYQLLFSRKITTQTVPFISGCVPLPTVALCHVLLQFFAGRSFAPRTAARRMYCSLSRCHAGHSSRQAALYHRLCKLSLSRCRSIDTHIQQYEMRTARRAWSFWCYIGPFRFIEAALFKRASWEVQRIEQMVGGR